MQNYAPIVTKARLNILNNIKGEKMGKNHGKEKLKTKDVLTKNLLRNTKKTKPVVDQKSGRVFWGRDAEKEVERLERIKERDSKNDQ